MVFTQVEFVVFVLGVVSLMCFLKSIVLKKITILLSSLYFYAYFDYRLLIVLVLSVFCTHISGSLINRSKQPVYKKISLIAGVGLNLGALLYFKYYNFFIHQINDLFLLDESSLNTIKIVVPLGISFYTFRFISYLVDVYRGDMSPCRLFDFTIYGLFFPVIISGPISRAVHFIPQLERISISKNNLYLGYRLFVIGLFLKVFVADRIAYYVNYFYANYEIFDTATTWLAVIVYSIQIYCDFAGYSSMAIGVAYLIGIRIEDNFNFPYLANNIQEFWKRWHMTLSEWIKDYLYIPLGGSRKGGRRKCINLLIVMTLCGFWHGSSWTFVLWGMLHGAMLIANYGWQLSNCRTFCTTLPRLFSLISQVVTFVSVTICWIFFRSTDLHQSFEIIKKLFLFRNDGYLFWAQPFVLFVVVATLFFHLLSNMKVKFISLPVDNKVTPTILFCLLWLVVVFFPKELEPFVYLQF
ncbi:putative membrane protein involved in D-alanine export [Desulfocapsa sulfexigens DSM 10523]|uniref:Putative membrane protein involved in D-alanine export n=1 Tax=Desulfocapsa sulfexigens (strain DSM 10523 / SB164P1) TaxID=1167006 RepID=M1P6C4_DESSD|nr:MBOAT family O-acyltransferase [Desulfocapsa sulfexigens]AGF78973.1 putative membrane protein involved in D-alanine export [Desulfocapsa sulfexigens DSM 10523]